MKYFFEFLSENMFFVLIFLIVGVIFIGQYLSQLNKKDLIETCIAAGNDLDKCKDFDIGEIK